MTTTDSRPLAGKHIVLGISGGIAAYKSAYLLRLLIKRGAEVQVVMTPAGKEFITPVTLSALSGKPVVSEFFTANSGEWHSHVDLGLWADLMVVAPATASTIAKMANGVADNMLVTTYLSAKEQVMVAPAMDLDMWAHPSTQRNVETLRRDGVLIVEPASGELASGLTGKGRMAEPEAIEEAVERYFNSRCDLQGRKVLITAGPTYEKIDPVRFIGNFSSGKMGFALAAECAARGAETVVVAGPVDASLTLPVGVKRIDVVSAREMLAAAQAEFADADIAILAAAVADYRPQTQADSKIKREKQGDLNLSLVANPDIAATLGACKKSGERRAESGEASSARRDIASRCLANEESGKGRRQYLVGFALETDHETENARRKMQAKNLDLIVLNSLREPGAGFMTDTNRVTLLRPQGEPETFPLKSKREVAADIVDAITADLKTPGALNRL